MENMANMANNISNVGFSDYSAEQADIKRRMKMAELMQQQGMEPFGPTENIGGWAIKRSPMEGIGRMAQAGAGAYMQNQAMERQMVLAQKIRADAQQQMGSMPQGTPAVPASPGQESVAFEGGVGPEQPGQSAQPASRAQLSAWARNLAMSGNPIVAPFGQKMAEEYMKPPTFRTATPGSVSLNQSTGEMGTSQVPAQQTSYTLSPDQQRFGPNNQPIATAPSKPIKDEGAWSEPYQMGGAFVQRNEMTGQVRQAVGREPQIKIETPPPITAVTIQDPKNPNATIVVDGRSGRVIGPGPKLTDTGKMETKRQFNMQGIGATIKQVEDILGGAAGKPLPTESGVGTLVDYAGSLVGASPKGAAEADKLRSAGASLVSKMPRMEGPQSDRDVALYKEAAGRVGDSTIPIARRKAALETVKELFAKYERLNPGAFEGSTPQGGKLSPAEQSELQQLRQRFGR